MTPPVPPPDVTAGLRALIATWRHAVGPYPNPHAIKSSAHKAILRCADELEAALQSPADPSAASDWQPIASAPKDAKVFFWIVPKLPEESYTDSSGKPIVAHGAKERWHHGSFSSWPATMKATHWMPDLRPPATQPSAVTAGLRERLLLQDCFVLMEGLRIGVEWELAPPIKKHIAELSDRLAAALRPAPPVGPADEEETT